MINPLYKGNFCGILKSFAYGSITVNGNEETFLHDFSNKYGGDASELPEYHEMFSRCDMHCDPQPHNSVEQPLRG